MFATYSSNSNNNNHSSWIMNESLAAFYLSTNTFSNPIFDANQSSLTPLHSNIHTSKIHNDPLKGEQDVMHSMEAKKEKNRIKPTIEMMEATFVASRRKCSNLCDSIAFSVKSKMFVLELNFKRRLQRLRRFAGKRLPWMLFCLSGSSQRNSNNNKETRMQYHHSSATEYRHEPPYEQQQQQQRQFWPSSTPIIISKKDEKFWSEIWPANSSESLVVQKEKILYRLERVLEAKRSANQVGAKLFNMGGNCGAIPTKLGGCCKPAAPLSAARIARRCCKEQNGGGGIQFLPRPQSSSVANNNKLQGKPKTTTLLGAQKPPPATTITRNDDDDDESRSKSISRDSSTPIASSAAAASPFPLLVSSLSPSTTERIGGAATSYKVQNGSTTTTTRVSSSGSSRGGGGGAAAAAVAACYHYCAVNYFHYQHH